MTSRYRRALPFHVHLVGEEFRLTSTTQLSEIPFCRPSSGFWGQFRSNGSHHNFRDGIGCCPSAPAHTDDYTQYYRNLHFKSAKNAAERRQRERHYLFSLAFDVTGHVQPEMGSIAM